METRRGHAKEGQIHIYMRRESFSFLQGDYFGEASFSEDGSSDVNKCDWIETGFRGFPPNSQVGQVYDSMTHNKGIEENLFVILTCNFGG